MVTLWGLRLALHIGLRNWGKSEDSAMPNGAGRTVRVGGGSFSKYFTARDIDVVIGVPILAAQSFGFRISRRWICSAR